jgi:hypothetical protein
MFRALSAFVLVFAAAACGSNQASTTALNQLPTQAPAETRAATGEPRPSATASRDPYAELPSNACGGFHLKIVNETSGFLEIDVNGAWSAKVESGATTVLTESLTLPQLPPLPWSVVIADATGDETYSTTVTGPVDQKITLTEATSTQAPYSLQAEGC